MTIKSIDTMTSQAFTAPLEPSLRNTAEARHSAEAGVAAAAAPVQGLAKAAATSATSTSSPEPTLDEVKQAAQRLQEQVQAKASNLIFSVDEKSNKTIVKVIDTKTNEVIRQFPSKEAIALAQALDQMQESHGLLLKQKV